jgi:hypothetical protein
MVTLVLLILLQTTAPGTAGSASPCAATEHRQFDFWIGDWEVRTAQGRVLGHNRITSILSGCALQEEWTSADGKLRGVSHNAFDPADRRWHQAWVDTSPSRLDLVGGIVDGRMVMEQRSRDAAGKALVQRITWTPLPEGHLRQVWETSTDDGRTWKTAFDGYYSRKRTKARKARRSRRRREFTAGKCSPCFSRRSVVRPSCLS